MEGTATISDEEIQRQEALKNQLLVKTAGQTKRVSSSEHRDDLRTLSALEQSLEDAAHYRERFNSNSDVSVAGDVNVRSNEVRLPPK